MTRGLTLSVAMHIALIVFAVTKLPDLLRPQPVEDRLMVVDVITVGEITNAPPPAEPVKKPDAPTQTAKARPEPAKTPPPPPSAAAPAPPPTPKAEAPKIEPPKVEAPKAEVPKAEPPKVEPPKPQAVRPAPPKPETPQVEPVPATRAELPSIEAAPVPQPQVAAEAEAVPLPKPKPQEAKKPEPEPELAPKPAPKPQEAKKPEPAPDAPKPVEVAKPEPPKPEPPKPEQAKPEPKPEQAKPEPETVKAAEATPEPPPPVPVSRPTPPKKPAKQQVAAKETPVAPDEKKRPDKTDDFMNVLKTVQKMKDSSAAPAEAEKSAPQTTDSTARRSNFDADRPLSVSEMDAVRQQITRCWLVPAGAKAGESLLVELRVRMNPDRTVREAEIVDTARMRIDPFFRAAAESARRALFNPSCSPLNLPPEKYETWKTFTITFDPKDMLS